MDRSHDFYNELLISSDVNSNNDENSVNSSIERPQVLNTVLRYHIDSLTDEIQSIRDNYSMTEFKNLVANKTLNEALLLCDKALRGSPIFGNDSPILSDNSPITQRSVEFENSSNLRLYTSLENSPITH